MSAPDSMPCLLTDPCPTPLSCSNAGTCSARVKDMWDSWWGAFAECKRLGIDLGPVLNEPVKITEHQRHNRENGGSFHEPR